MRLFDLQWLRGAGTSVEENFEILCLELLRAEYPDGDHQRVGAPDRGIPSRQVGNAAAISLQRDGLRPLNC
jgi:hypothetical protein